MHGSTCIQIFYEGILHQDNGLESLTTGPCESLHRLLLNFGRCQLLGDCGLASLKAGHPLALLLLLLDSRILLLLLLCRWQIEAGMKLPGSYEWQPALRRGDNEAGSEEDINKKRLLGHGFCTLTLAADE